MSQPQKQQPNKFVRGARKVYNPIGFSKGYNFILWFCFAGAFFGFILARSPYLNLNGVLCKPNNTSQTLGALPGECFYYTGWTRYKVGIQLHLFGVLPAGLLAVLQFTPVIRHKATIFHRLNGYVIILLALIGDAGALMIADRAFGGTLATQTFVGALAIMTVGGLTLAYVNIKRLRIDLHRAWMLRTWFYFGTIITIRAIDSLMAMIISSKGFYFIQPCDKLLSMFNDGDVLSALYPACAAFVNGSDLAAKTIVKCDMNGNVAELTSALNISFGVSCWLALLLHAVGVEVYIQMTPKESQRLRNVSYERRLEAGKEKSAVSKVAMPSEEHTDAIIPA